MKNPSSPTHTLKYIGKPEREPLFPPEMPVTYDADGNVVSRFGHHSWDVSSMSTDGTSGKNFHFYCSHHKYASELRSLIREQHKALIWLHMDSGRTRAFHTLLTTILALNAWCIKASIKGICLYTILTTPEFVEEGVKDLNRLYVDQTSTALKTLWRHRQRLGVKQSFPLHRLQEIINQEARGRPDTQQTPLIPSRVYCAILSALDNRMEVIERELDTLLESYSIIPRSTDNALDTSLRSDLMERLKKVGCNNAIRGGLSNFVAGRICEHQVSLMLTISAYSGMRLGEVAILPLSDVLLEFQHLGQTHYELQGFTHKLHKGVKTPAAWITSHQGVRAVRLAQRIGQVVERLYDEPPKTGQRALLFPSTRNPYKSISAISYARSLARLQKTLCPIVEQVDIEELDNLELARGWARDGIVVGEHWPLAVHQLRRSLAVYAHRSGMVSLPALKAQLQHITQEMAAYYADGFSRAVNLVFDKDHFSHEWQAAKAESSYFAYAFAVLFSDEPILGEGAKRMANTVEARSRQDTLRLFQENKLSYRETVLGGCSATESCKLDPLEPIPYDCLQANCVNQVVFSKRLDHIIKFQEISVATLENDETGSVEHRLEARHLQMLITARKRLQNGVQ